MYNKRLLLSLLLILCIAAGLAQVYISDEQYNSPNTVVFLPILNEPTSYVDSDVINAINNNSDAALFGDWLVDNPDEYYRFIAISSG